MPQLASSDEHELEGHLVQHVAFSAGLRSRGDEERICVAARIVRAKGEEARRHPYLLFLQGGPGFESPRRVSPWIAEACKSYQVVLLDQRGTGASTALTTEWLESEQASGKTESELADYVAQFRADAIVRDAEQLRELLGAQRWTVLGQSFGGFCCVHYAGRFPDSLDGIVTLGGLPLLQPTEADIAATYRRCLDVVERKVKAYYRAFPGDIARVRRIMHALEAGPVGLPRGGVLTARRFRTLGIGLGFAGGAERLHELVDACFCARPAPSGSAVEFSLDLAGDAFAPLAAVEEATSHFERNPLYFALHESIYCDGTSSSWAASQAVGQRGATVPLDDGTEAESFIGEMVMPWMAEDYHRLAPWAGLAHKLAERKWPRLYAAWDHQTASDVPLAAAVYTNDMYVPRSLSLRTARRFRYAHVWETAAYEHSGIAEDGPHILRTLFAGLERQQRLRARAAHWGIQRTRRVRTAAAVVGACVAAACMAT